MSNQVQCPNCGGYKVSQNIDRIDPATGNMVGSGGCGIAVLFSILGFALAIYGTMSGNSVIGFSGTALMVLVGFPLIVWLEIKKGQSQKRAYNLYNYQCNLCGYQWSWREGQPKSKVNIRPDLIERGEQRLEKEHQKQQEDAAALYHLTHKK